MKRIDTCTSSSTFPLLSDDKFWKKVESTPSVKGMKEEDPVIIQGKLLFSSVKEGKREMALSCTEISKYVENYLMKSTSIGTVCDLGCGMGVNSIPFLKKGWKVIAIDKEVAALLQFKQNIQELGGEVAKNAKKSINLVEKDLTVYDYPKNVDVVLCVDVLSYLLPNQLKATLLKILQALRPGGHLIGTLFFKSSEKEDPLAELLGKLGAHFYLEEALIKEIIQRSGFKIVEGEERRDDPSSVRCFEFLAEKPNQKS